MTYFRLVQLSSLAFFVAACGSSNSDGVNDNTTPSSKIVTLNTDGSLPDQNFSENGTSGSGSRLRTTNGELNGYSFAYGQVVGTQDFLGVAGIAPSSNPGEAITLGSVSYAGTYSLAHIRNTTVREDGDITMVASFADGSLTGAADNVKIDGTFNGTTLDGTVTAFGVTADLDGVVGETRAVGAFAGNSDNAVLVGGFLVDAVQ